MKNYILINGTVRAIKDGLDKETVIANLRAKGFDVQSVGKPPSIKTLEKWMMDGIAKATDGCRIEPDGQCQHGHKSWLLVLGFC